MAVAIKKYGNRRLYDPDTSHYITLAELADKIRGGTEVRVVDAKTGADLTQATLTQVIIEDRNAGQLLPAPLLHQLIRMGDDALAEFLGRYVTRALELYLHARQGMGAVGAFNPFSAFVPSDPFAAFSPPAAEPVSREVEALRREVDDLKKAVRKRRR